MGFCASFRGADLDVHSTIQKRTKQHFMERVIREFEKQSCVMYIDAKEIYSQPILYIL